MSESNDQENFALEMFQLILRRQEAQINELIQQVYQGRSPDHLRKVIQDFKQFVQDISYLEDMRGVNHFNLASELLTALLQTVYADPSYNEVLLRNPPLVDVFFKHGANPNAMSGGLPFFLEVIRDIDEKKTATEKMMIEVFVENGLNVADMNSHINMLPKIIFIVQDGIVECYQQGKLSLQQQFEVFKALVKEMIRVAEAHDQDCHKALELFINTHFNDQIGSDNKKLQEVLEVIPGALHSHYLNLKDTCERCKPALSFFSAPSLAQQEFIKFEKLNAIAMSLFMMKIGAGYRKEI